MCIRDRSGSDPDILGESCGGGCGKYGDGADFCVASGKKDREDRIGGMYPWQHMEKEPAVCDQCSVYPPVWSGGNAGKKYAAAPE